MAVLNATGADFDERVDEQFIDLICTVEGLVDVEFADMVCADRARTAQAEADRIRGPYAGVRTGRSNSGNGGRRVAASAGTTATERSPPLRLPPEFC